MGQIDITTEDLQQRIIDGALTTGKVKVNFTGLERLNFDQNDGELPFNFSDAGVTATIEEASTNFPQGMSGIDDVIDFTNNLLKVGQVDKQITKLRILGSYANKNSNNNTGLILKVDNPDTAFEEDDVKTLPNGTTTSPIKFNFEIVSNEGVNIGDGKGYELKSLQTTGDNIDFIIDSILWEFSFEKGETNNE